MLRCARARAPLQSNASQDEARAVGLSVCVCVCACVLRARQLATTALDRPAAHVHDAASERTAAEKQTTTDERKRVTVYGV